MLLAKMNFARKLPRLLRAIAATMVMFGLIQCGQKKNRKDDKNTHDNFNEEIATASGRAPLSKIDNPPLPLSGSKSGSLRITGEQLLSYRYKIGPKETIDCHLAAGYSPESPIENELDYDLSEFPDGPFSICVIGKNIFNEWQALDKAENLSWMVDSTPPEPFNLNPFANLVSRSKDIELNWDQPQDSSQLVYSIKISHHDDPKCQTPKITRESTELSVKVPQNFTAGRYAVCVTAVDQAGHSQRASTSGEAIVEVSPELHVSFISGKSYAQSFHHAARTLDVSDWKVVSLAIPEPQRFLGRASATIDAKGSPRLTYHVLDQSNSLAKWAVMSAYQFENKWTHEILLAGNDSLTMPVMSAHALDSSRFSKAFIVASRDQLPRLFFSAGDASITSQIKTVSLEVDNNSRNYKDISMKFDAQGITHLFYVLDNYIVHRFSSDGETWSTGKSIVDPLCSDIQLSAVAAESGQGVAIAYSCSILASDSSQCVVRLVRNITGSNTNDPSATINALTSDDQRNCLPFDANRPALEIDRYGRAHIVVPHALSENGADQTFGISYFSAINSQISQQFIVAGNQNSFGFPRLALDADGNLFVLYETDNKLALATKKVDGNWILDETTVHSLNQNLAGRIHSVVNFELAGSK